MSFNQSRDKSSGGGGGDSQYRKSGYRSGNAAGASSYRRTYSGKPSVGEGGPPGSYQRANSNSFKKSNSVQGQGGQLIESVSSANPEVNNVGGPSQNIQSSVSQQVPSRGAPELHANKNFTGTNAASSFSSRNPAGPKSSQYTSVSSDLKPPQTHPKTEGGASKGFALQFGSISPGLVNGIQIPPRTTSAPPNLDEQNQAHHDFSRTTHAPAMPLPSIPKHPVKEPNVVKHPVAALHNLEKGSQVSSPTLSSPPKHFVTPISSLSTQVAFHPHPSQGPFQFGVRPQFQPRMMPPTSHQMPPILPKGSGPLLQQPIFVPLPSIQPHPMQVHGIMHQGQGLSFPNQFGPQMPLQMSNIGINLGPHLTPMQAGKYGSPSRTVKITHPDTREELRLDRRGETVAVGSLKAGIQNTVPRQPQPVLPVVTTHSSNYNPSSFASSVYRVPAISAPLSTQITPDLQTSRAHYPVSQGLQSQAANKKSVSIHGQAETLNKESTRNISSKVDPVTVLVGNKVNQTGSSNANLIHGANVTTSTVASKSYTGVDDPVFAKSPTSANTQSTPPFEVRTCIQGSNEGSVTRPRSIKDQHKQPNHMEQHQSQPQEGGQVIAPPTTTLPSDNRTAKITEGTPSVALSGTPKVVLVASSEDRVSPDASVSPKLSVSIKPLYEGSGEHVESLQNKALEQVSSKLNASIKEDVMKKENSSVEGCGAQNGVMESVIVRSQMVSEVDLGQPAVSTEKYETRTGDSKPPTTVFESKGAESLKETTPNHVDGIDSNITGSNDRAPLELNMPKSATAKDQRKIKEMLQKEDAAGATSDLCTAYKAPEEKENASSTVATGSDFSIADVEHLPLETKEHIIAGKNQTHGECEPDNWEDADDAKSLELKIAGKPKSGSSGSIHDAVEMKKYTKDFLMKFKDRCDTLPENFYIPPELVRALLAPNVRSVKVDRSVSDRSLGTARSESERREMDDNKWMKGSGSSSSRDLRPDFGHGKDMTRPGSGGSSGGRHPRVQAGHYSGGILSGPLQPMNSFHRDNAEGDRWRRHPNSQRGLISSPHTPSQTMHKAEKKYEVGKVTDEEQAKQRQLKGILNKLTPQNFERLFEQVKAVNIDNAVTLTGVISQIFDKALMEPTFCEMYADFCYHLSVALPDFTSDDEKITFKRVLLNKCQEEFERGEREEEEANKVEEEGEVALSNEEREEKKIMARRRMLGNIRLIGELYKKRMLTERIMHECIKKLLGPQQNADEENIEALCKLMSTIGEMIDHPKAKTHLDAYFDMMFGLSNSMKYSSRVRFMLKDSIDLRKNKWQQRRKVEGPKKIEDVHRDAAHERQAQSSRLARGPSMNASNRRGTPTDFGPRSSSILPSPNSQHVEYRSFPSQARGFGGTQDVRMEDRQPLYEGRNVSVPLLQRGAGSDSVTLGPQGGLARGMSMRGARPALITQTPGLNANGYRHLNERSSYNSNENAMPRSASGRLVVPANSQTSGLELDLTLENELKNSDQTTDRAMEVDTTLPVQTLSEEHLRTMSTSTIKEFYSAKDEREVAVCIKDMNTPSFHPSMVALWVSDSFERKDMERNLLSKLLVSLAKQDNTLTHNDLLKGFESVLAILEDAATDAPKAPEFLGRLFATVIMENVIPLRDIREIVHKGGEEPGSLVESGLGGDVIGNILEVIQSNKGDSYLNEIRSGLRLEEFRPPQASKSKKLEKFL